MMARGGRSRGPPGQPARTDSTDEDSRAERIRVVVRVRPENTNEEAGNFRTVVRVVGEEMLVFDPKEQGTPDYYHGKARRQRDINKRSARDISFVFDRVFGSNSTTMDLFENTTKKILDGLMDGYNCSVFAYGATGAGKTHTMLGTTERPGVIFLTMMDLYRRMEEVKDTNTCDIAVSYLEVYNEQIRDLLMPGGYLPVREDPQRGVMITGLSLHKPHSADELMHMLRIGNSNRTQHPTDANAESSRSHAVFQVFVRQRERTANTSADWRVAKMSLIDLAGSERATVTKNRGARFREGANINRSLLALGNCINALAEGKTKGYVPYRNSKLTRLLKDSLGGNCRTVMIAAISPSSMSFEDTYNTLRYADRAKNIKVGLKRNVVSVDLHVSRYVQVIEDLRKEVNELKLKLRDAENGIMPEGKCSPDLSSKATYERISTSLDSVFRARIEVRKEILELESSERDLQYKAYRKQLTLTRIGIIAPGEMETTKCLRRAIDNADRRRKNIETRRQSLISRMGDNNSWLYQVEGEIEKSRPNNILADLLEENLRTRHLDIELRDMRRQAKYLKKLCRAQEREAHAMEKFNTVLLQTVYSQYMLIKGHNIASTKEIDQFEMVQQMACQNMGRTVAWADQSFGADENMPNVPVTPGPQSGEFSVGPLLEFPILSIVPATPSRTPHQGKRTSTNIPETPASSKRRRRTPRRTPRSARKQRCPNLTPSNRSPTPDTSESVNTDDYVYKAPPQASSPSCACRTDGQFQPPSPPGFRSSSSGGNHADQTCPAQNLFGGQNHDRHLGSIKGPVGENSPVVEGVFPLQPSPDANPPVSRVSPIVDQPGTTASLPKPNLEIIPEPAHVQPLPSTKQSGDGPISNGKVSRSPEQRIMDSTIVLGPAIVREYEQPISQPVMDSTMVINSTLGLRLPNASSPPQRQELGMSPKTPGMTNVVGLQMVNSATVTKPVPVLHQGATVTKTKPVVNGNTITKQVHRSATVTKLKENDENAYITPPNGPGSVVRSMDFGGVSCPSPAGGPMSFAEALKSPAPARILQLQQGQPPRSPLARRDNFMNNDIQGPPPRRMTFAPGSRIPPLSQGKMFHSSKDAKHLMKQPLPDNPNNRRFTLHTRRVAEATETLRRFGVPSVLDKPSVPKVAPGSSGSTPGYMKPTKAASRRNKNHRRSITANDDSKPSGLARRIFVQNENAPPPARRNLAQSRSKSLAHLSMKPATINKKPVSAFIG